MPFTLSPVQMTTQIAFSAKKKANNSKFDTSKALAREILITIGISATAADKVGQSIKGGTPLVGMNLLNTGMLNRIDEEGHIKKGGDKKLQRAKKLIEGLSTAILTKGGKYPLVQFERELKDIKHKLTGEK